jgi:HAD superfamily hydrolase (TIGR01549 family)
MKIFNKERFKCLPEAILLDIDNTIYPYDMSHKPALEAVKNKIVSKFSISEDDFQRAYNNARLIVKKRLVDTASSHSRLLYFQQMLEYFGLGSHILLALDLEQTYWRVFLNNTKIFEGVVEFLENVKYRGISIAFITDLTSQIQFRKLVYLGVDSLFDFIVTSEEVGHDKPHKAPFERALEKLNCEGSRVWMIGDNFNRDIIGARKEIKATTLQIKHNSNRLKTTDDNPDIIFYDFLELKTFFDKIEFTE